MYDDINYYHYSTDLFENGIKYIHQERTKPKKKTQVINNEEIKVNNNVNNNDNVDVNNIEYKIVEEFINNCYTINRADNYKTWRNVGLALNNYFDKETDLYLFNLFSSKSSKYNNVECEVFYDNLTKNCDGLSIG